MRWSHDVFNSYTIYEIYQSFKINPSRKSALDIGTCDCDLDFDWVLHDAKKGSGALLFSFQGYFITKAACDQKYTYRVLFRYSSQYPSSCWYFRDLSTQPIYCNISTMCECIYKYWDSNAVYKQSSVKAVKFRRGCTRLKADQWEIQIPRAQGWGSARMGFKWVGRALVLFIRPSDCAEWTPEWCRKACEQEEKRRSHLNF